MLGLPKIDLAWEAVNAIGGTADQNNSYDQGYVDGVGKALEAIEKLGGKDPLPQRHADNVAVIHRSISSCGSVESILAAIVEYDEAKRAHFRDCWLHDDKDEERINGRYRAYIEAERRAFEALRMWTGRHAIEFQIMQRSMDAVSSAHRSPQE